MCPPDHFTVEYAINPWMDISVAVDAALALKQWQILRETLTDLGHAVHVRHAEVAFEAGLHLLTEKPIAASMDDARRMVKLAKDADRVLMVAQNYRYSPAAQTLIRLMREKPLGQLGHGHIDFYIPADFPGSFRETMPHVLLVDMAIHHLDLVRAVTGRNITRVTAQSFKTPWSWYRDGPGLKMLMTLDGGVPFSYSGDWTGRGRLTTWNGAWRLQCEHGCIELLHDGTIRLTRSDKWENGVVAETVPPDDIPENYTHALMTRFIEACRTNTPPDTSGADNLWSFAAVQAGVRSAESSTSVDVTDLLRA